MRENDDPNDGLHKQKDGSINNYRDDSSRSEFGQSPPNVRLVEIENTMKSVFELPFGNVHHHFDRYTQIRKHKLLNSLCWQARAANTINDSWIIGGKQCKLKTIAGNGYCVAVVTVALRCRSTIWLDLCLRCFQVANAPAERKDDRSFSLIFFPLLCLPTRSAHDPLYFTIHVENLYLFCAFGDRADRWSSVDLCTLRPLNENRFRLVRNEKRLKA